MRSYNNTNQVAGQLCRHWRWLLLQLVFIQLADHLFHLTELTRWSTGFIKLRRHVIDVVDWPARRRRVPLDLPLYQRQRRRWWPLDPVLAAVRHASEVSGKTQRRSAAVERCPEPCVDRQLSAEHRRCRCRRVAGARRGDQLAHRRVTVACYRVDVAVRRRRPQSVEEHTVST